MTHHIVIEYESVRQPRKEEVEHMDSDECQDDEREKLTGDIITGPCGHWWTCRRRED